MLIEKLSGQAYETYVERNVFGPLGMANTSYCDGIDPAPGKAVGYDRDLTPSEAWLEYIERSHGLGTVCTTVEDMYRLFQGLVGRTLLSQESIDSMFTAHWGPETSETGYSYGFGYGWMVPQRSAERYWVGQGAPGGVVRWYLDEQALVVVLSNTWLTHPPEGPLDLLALGALLAEVSIFGQRP